MRGVWCILAMLFRVLRRLWRMRGQRGRSLVVLGKYSDTSMKFGALGVLHIDAIV